METKCLKCDKVIRAGTEVALHGELDIHLTNGSCGYKQTTKHKYIRHIKKNGQN